MYDGNIRKYNNYQGVCQDLKANEPTSQITVTIPLALIRTQI